MTRRPRRRTRAHPDHSERNFVIGLMFALPVLFALAFPEIASAAAKWLIATMR